MEPSQGSPQDPDRRAGERGRQTDRQADGQTDGPVGGAGTERKHSISAVTNPLETKRRTDRQTDRQTGRQTDSRGLATHGEAPVTFILTKIS